MVEDSEDLKTSLISQDTKFLEENTYSIQLNCMQLKKGRAALWKTKKYLIKLSRMDRSIKLVFYTKSYMFIWQDCLCIYMEVILDR